MPVDVAVEELAGERLVPGQVGEGGAGVGRAVGTVNHAGRRGPAPSIPLPEQPHVVVEGGGEADAVGGAGAQQQVEPDPQHLAPRVVRDEEAAPVGGVDGRRGVGERGEAAHVRRRPEAPAGAALDRLDGRPETGQGLRQRGEPRPLQNQRPVVVGEALGQPQLARRVDVLEVERLERAGTDALHVPDVEELVRHRAEKAAALPRERRRRAQHGAVPVLHGVARRRRQVVGDERVAARLEPRELAEHGDHLAHDALDVPGVAVEVALAAGVVHGDAELGPVPGIDGIGDREGPLRERAHLGRAVEQVRQVGRREDEGIVGRIELRGHPPPAVGRGLEADGGRPVLEPVPPHEAGRHVQVGVSVVDREVGAIDAVAVDAVGEPDGAVMAGHVPPRHRGADRLEGVAGAVGRPHLEHVLGEVVPRVASRRGGAHPHAQGAGRQQVGHRHRDLHPALLRPGEAQLVAHRGAVGAGLAGLSGHPGLPPGARHEPRRREAQCDQGGRPQRDDPAAPPGHATDPTTWLTNSASGTAPRISVRSFIRPTPPPG